MIDVSKCMEGACRSIFRLTYVIQLKTEIPRSCALMHESLSEQRGEQIVAKREKRASIAAQSELANFKRDGS